MAIEKARPVRLPDMRLPGWFAGAAIVALVLVAGGIGALVMAQFEQAAVQVQLPSTVPAAATPGSVPAAVAVNTVTVVGEGRVVAAPDTIYVDLGAEVSKPTLAAALTAATADQSKLSAALKKAGIAAADMQTTGLNTYARTDSYGNPAGYGVSSYLRVRIRDVSKATAILTAAAGAIGNDIRVNSLQYQRANIATQVSQARQAAIASAAERAVSNAKASGRQIGHITEIREQFVGYVGAGQMVSGGIGSAGGGGVTVPTVQSGQGEVVVQLVVTYSMS